jgi:hypothetical protein
MADAASELSVPSDETLLRSWLRHMISDVHWRAYEYKDVLLNDQSFDHVQVDLEDDGTFFYVRSSGGIREHMRRSTYVMTVHAVPEALRYLLKRKDEQDTYINDIRIIGLTVSRMIPESKRFADHVVNEAEIPEVFSDSECDTDHDHDF